MDSRKVAGYIVFAVCFSVFVALAVVGVFFPERVFPGASIVAIVAMFLLALAWLRYTGSSDHAKAQQTNRTLDLASQTLSFMREGLSADSAQAVCDLLLPSIEADAVAITDCEKILGFSGIDKENHAANSPIQTETTKLTLEDGQTRVVDTSDGLGFTRQTKALAAGIIAPFIVNKRIVGTLKFYYRSPKKLDENQKAMAEGFAQLLATQLSLSYLQQQTELAAQMELKALQAQINPHFLFNTINTIAAITRTDSAKARVMLREFAIYYRRLLENSEDLIPLRKEIEQTERYLMFQKARFGEDSIVMDIDVEPGLEELPVPSFVMQPIVENAVGHGRRETGTLHIHVRVYHASDSVIISIEDDGVGIAPDRLSSLVEGGSKTGMGVALKNVNARLKAYFGSISGIYVESTLDEGTTVHLTLYDALAKQDDETDEDKQRAVLAEPPAVEKGLFSAPPPVPDAAVPHPKHRFRG